MNCSFKHCKLGEIVRNGSRVEIKTKLPTNWQKLKVKDKKLFLIHWHTSGDAVFHTVCWDVIHTTSKSRKRKPNGNYVMTSQEKTLVREAAKTAEKFDSLDKVQNEAKAVAEMLKSCDHCVVFTGAGISTSAGIGDYRGKSGKWTEMDQERLDVDQTFDDVGKQDDLDDQNNDASESEHDNEEEGVQYEELRPTYTHEAIAKLMNLGMIKYIISQNGDGLHTLSGVPAKKISELHGNVFQEKCEKCSKVYDRSFYVMDDVASQYYEELQDFGKTDIIKPKNAKQCQTCGLSHRTGRKCDSEKCGGFLKDTIINFGDMLEEDIMLQAEEHSASCDLMICLGTTLTVSPACDLILMRKQNSNLVICNRQETEKDHLCEKGSRIFGDCDVFLKEIMKNILDSSDLQKWEDDRTERMVHYNAKRQPSS